MDLWKLGHFVLETSKQKYNEAAFFVGEGGNQKDNLVKKIAVFGE